MKYQTEAHHSKTFEVQTIFGGCQRVGAKKTTWAATGASPSRPSPIPGMAGDCGSLDQRLLRRQDVDGHDHHPLAGAPSPIRERGPTG